MCAFEQNRVITKLFVLNVSGILVQMCQDAILVSQ